jgi:hypothetical protein
MNFLCLQAYTEGIYIQLKFTPNAKRCEKYFEQFVILTRKKNDKVNYPRITHTSLNSVFQKIINCSYFR